MSILIKWWRSLFECKCGKQGQFWHMCPFQKEVNNDFKFKCTCCEKCTCQCEAEV